MENEETEPAEDEVTEPAEDTDVSGSEPAEPQTDEPASNEQLDRIEAAIAGLQRAVAALVSGSAGGAESVDADDGVSIDDIAEDTGEFNFDFD